MDNFVHGQESGKQQNPKRSLASLTSPASILKWLAALFKLTEEERENAGVYLDRLGDE